MTKFLALFLKVIITLPLIAFLFFITLTNRNSVLDLAWSPFHDASSVSLPIILFGALVIGFIWGSLILWSNTLFLRAERRALKKQVSGLEKQIELQKLEAGRLAAQAYVAPMPSPTPRIASPDIL